MNAPKAGKAPERSLAHLPVGSFASIMGLGGLAIAYLLAHRLWGITALIGQGIAVFGLVIFMFILVTYTIKAVKFPAARAKEWAHPVQSAFVPAISIALLVLAIAFYSWAPGISAVLWWTGAVVQAILTLLTVRTWIHDAAIEQIHVHPAWFIPAVGNLIAPIAGVHHAPDIVVWYFYGVGVIYWIGLLPVVLARLFTAGTLPPRLVPTLAILVAPPAVAALSWVALGGSWTDALARVMMATVVFQLLLLAVQAPALRSTPFAISSWAYTFPLAAASSALLSSSVNGGYNYGWFAGVVLGVTTVVVGFMVWRTVIAVARGEICRPH